MAAEAQRVSDWTREQIDFAQVWVRTWRQLGGYISADMRGWRHVSYPISRVDAETRGALRAMMALLDALPAGSRTSVFAAAQEAGR